MKATVIGVVRRVGVGKESKKAYDISTLHMLVPIAPVARENMQVSGYGFEVMECELHPDALQSFAGIKFPAVLDLETDMVPRFGKLQIVVAGIKQ